MLLIRRSVVQIGGVIFGTCCWDTVIRRVVGSIEKHILRKRHHLPLKFWPEVPDNKATIIKISHSVVHGMRCYQRICFTVADVGAGLPR